MGLKASGIVLAVTLVALVTGLANADVFNMGGTRDPLTGTWTGLASLEMVTVGNPADSSRRGQGSVAYVYRIGAYEVTVGQYVEFLNAKAAADPYGLYNTNMWSSQSGYAIQRSVTAGHYIYSASADYANRPVNHVSYWDACRFTNWLHNGQGNGSTETGAYTLNGYKGTDGATIAKNANADFWIPTRSEWYKAAYYDPNKPGGGGYWSYATGTDAPPGQDMSEATNPGNNANYHGTPYPIDSDKYTTVAGQFRLSHSPYGTFDQSGNVREWDNNKMDGKWSGNLMGGDFFLDAQGLQAGVWTSTVPTNENMATGFRVVGSVPESSTLALLGMGIVGLIGYAWRRGKPA